MSIIIGADIVPTDINIALFKEGDVEKLIGTNLIHYLYNADYRVFNLEVPLSNKINPIKKNGPTLCAKTATIVGIKKIGVDLFTLANNHIMDQGEQGLISTIDTLEKNKIAHLGAGMNLAEAQKSFITYINGKRIGFYACTEHEFSIAQENVPGANPFNPLESFDHVANLRKECDYVIVLYHGGKEHYQYPSPMLQQVCRKFVQKGGGLVICQHSHCIGCEEKFGDGTIVYGQGNFIFNSNCGPYSETSLLIKLNDDFSVEYIPLSREKNGVRLAMGVEANAILSAFEKRSEQIKEKNFVTDEYRKFAKKMLDGYMLFCSGYYHKTWLRILNRFCGHHLAGKITNRYSSKEILALRNYIECEAHRELWTEGLLQKKL